MRVCPACARLFLEGQSICPEDGIFLRAPEDPLTGQTVGNYLFMGCVGRGGMGTVFRGEHVVIGKAVALKVLHPEHRQNPQGMQRFLAEARAASMIRHPNIVDVTDYGQLPDGRPFFVMEFLEGPNLAHELERLGELPVFRTVSILTQVCQALHACHSQGIVHRDLKPENIVLQRREGARDLVTLPSSPASNPEVTKEGFWDEVKILDFGVARIHQITTLLDQETQRRGLIFGSPYYMAPEQAMGELGDLRVDLYAVGVIFFEMITGHVPFNGNSAPEIMRRHCRDPVPSLLAARPDLALPPEADRLAQRVMAKRPADRHPSAANLLRDLSECFGNVIYGRDIPRYMQVRRRRTREFAAVMQEAQAPPAGAGPAATKAAAALGPAARPVSPSLGHPSPSAHSAPPRSQEEEERILGDLADLFKGKYESPRPVVDEEMPHPGSGARQEGRCTADEVRDELDGLFGGEDEDR